MSETLEEAKARLRIEAINGTKCPCCTQTVKIYARQVNAGMVRSLAQMYNLEQLGWIHIPTRISARSREEGKLALWGLVEEQRVARPDGGRAGWWRVTERGEAYLFGQLKIPKYARVFNDRLLGFDGEMRSVHDAVKLTFDLQELMSA